MGRKKRVWIPHYFYHIVCRGNRRDPLFMDNGDFLTFLYILRKIHEKYPFELASYCLMTNHFHLQLRSTEQSISKIMALINKRYANYFNTRYNLTGHLFEKRFFDKVILSTSGMLEVSRYIHLNPVKANIVEKPEDYRWGSYLYFMGQGKIEQPYFNSSILLDEFEGEVDERVRKYCEYVGGGACHHPKYVEKELNP